MTDPRKHQESTEGVDRWRYAVGFAKFLVHVLHPGIPRSLSVLLPSLVYQLDLDYTTVGFLITLEIAMMYLACPISNHLSRKFGPRLVATVGGFMAGLSLVVAFFGQTVESLGCSFFFTGFFASSLRQISSTTLLQHFGNRFGFAEAITHIGTQVGCFLLPYLTVICLNSYGWRGSILFLSGLVFHGVPIGAAMRPPCPRGQLAKRGNDCFDKVEHDDFIGEQVQPNDFLMQSRTSDSEHSNLEHCEYHEIELQQDENVLGYSQTKPEFSCTDLEDSESPETFSCLPENLHNSAKEVKGNLPIWIFIRDYILKKLNESLMNNERIFIFLLLPCQFLFDISYSSWAYFSVSYGVSVGMPEDKAVFLLMMGSVGGIVGRFVLIAILYKSTLLTPQLFAANSGISSLALLAYPARSSLTYLIVCSFIAGFGFYNSFSSYYGVLSLKVKKENFPKAMSYSLMLSGVALLLGGVLTGLFYDLFKSYPLIFRVLGLFMGLDCIVMTVYLFVSSRSKQGN